MARITKTMIREKIEYINKLTGKHFSLYSAYGYYGLDLMAEDGTGAVHKEFKHGVNLKELGLFLDGMIEALEL